MRDGMAVAVFAGSLPNKTIRSNKSSTGKFAGKRSVAEKGFIQLQRADLKPFSGNGILHLIFIRSVDNSRIDALQQRFRLACRKARHDN